MNSNPVEQALSVMDRHIEALNARDSDALAATLHFPHFRLSGTTLKTWDTPRDYLGDFLKRAGTDWGYSAFNDIKVIQSSDTKVHLDAEIRRYRDDHTIITQFRSLWVIIEHNGIWAAKFRSSFANQ